MRPDLASCYGQERLPRYTSYPTAPHFSPAVGPDTYAEWLKTIPCNASASLYLHVPFCRAMCWYCGCHTSVVRRDEPIAVYASALRCEIEQVTQLIDRRLPVDHVHFGGGTPTIMAPETFVDLIGSIRHSFFIRPSAEVAVEIDPRTLSREMIEALAFSGVNRASLGVQSFDPVVQRAINRVQSYEATAAATEGLRRAGIAGINFDLIYGLPHQTVDSCLDTVRKCMRLRPDRLSVFGYAHVPTFKKLQRKIDAAALPGSLERHRQFEVIAGALTQAGYVRIGLDHFALPDDRMAVALREGTLRRNFQGYTTDVGTVLLGFGASAIGRLPQGYVQNEVGTRAYSQAIACGRLATVKGYALTDDDRLRAEIIERIMCDFGADLGPICARHGSVAVRIAIVAPTADPDFGRGRRARRCVAGSTGRFAIFGSQRRGRLRCASGTIERAAQPRSIIPLDHELNRTLRGHKVWPSRRVTVCRTAETRMPIGFDHLVDDAMRDAPETIRVFLQFRMGCVGCPIACFHTVDDACREHGVDREVFLDALRSVAAEVIA